MRELENKYIVHELSDFYSSLEYAQIPAEVVAKARAALIDTMGVIILGYRKGVMPKIVNDLLLNYKSKEESTWLSMGVRSNSVDASMSMAVAAHSVELDDGYRFGTAHPAVVVIPAALALCERENKTFVELLKAIIIGYDAMLRIARAINPSHWQRGFHSTSTCGVIGSAFACASLLGMNAHQMAHTVSIAALQSAGLQEMLHDNPSIKPFQVGKSSAGGLMAAELVLMGAKGPKTIFEGQHGWLRAMSGEYKRQAIFFNIGEEFEIMRTYTKLYPTCRHCHAVIDLALEARLENQSSNQLIESILVKTYDIAIAEVGKIYKPESYEDAMFSLPFSIALALTKGRVTLNDYIEANFCDRVLRNIQEKVIIEADDEINKMYPEERGVILQIKCESGMIWKKKASLPKGEPERPLSRDDLHEKFLSCASPYFMVKVLENIWSLIVNEDIHDVSYDTIVNLLNR